MDVGAVLRRGAGLRARPGGARREARREALGHRRQPPAPLLGPDRRAGPRWRLGARLPGLDREGARVRLESRRGRHDRRRGPGAGRQGALPPRGPPGPPPRRLRRRARHVPLPPRLAQVLPGGSGARAEVRPGASGPLRSGGREGRGGRARVHLLHLGDHREPEGGDAHARERDRDRPDGGRGRGLPRRRRLSGLSADGLGGRRLLHADHEPLRGLRVQLPGEPGDGAARPAGARADAHAGAAADLGEHAHVGAGEGGRRAVAQALDLRALPCGGRARRDPPRGRQGRARVAAPAAGTRRVLRLRASARPARPAPRALGVDGRRAARPRHVPILPLDRRQPQTGLRLHRDDRPGLAPAERRGEPDDGGPPVSRHRRQDRRARRGARQERGHLQGLPQERGGDAGSDRPGGLVPHG